MMKLLLFALTFKLWGGTGLRQKRADDATLEAVVERQGLQIQQQEVQIQTLQAKLTALEERLPSPVAFTVHFSSDDPDNGIALGPQQILKFDNVVTNLGNGYNVETGIFSAPVSGAYSFFLSIMSTNTHAGVMVAMVNDGSILDIVFAEGLTDKQDQGSTQVSIHLQAGQQVWARQYTGDAVRGQWWTIFTGYLIQAD